MAGQYVHIRSDDLELYEFCGDGSYGSVYRGLWKSKNKEVAVKKMLYLQKEAEHLSLLSHKNIIQFYGAVTEEANFCIVTEYAQNGSLYAYLRLPNLKMKFEDILTWAEDIAQGMNYLHNEAPVAMIHRDLKSRNVVIDSDLVCKICDFGSSRTFTNTTKMSVVGTYPWMAPEVILARPVSEACDTWSYGVVIWELLTMEVPFSGLEGIQVAWQVIEKGERLTIPKECPPQFAELMSSCWKEEPGDRPNFKTILNSLRRMSGDDSLKNETSSFLTQKTKWKEEIDQGLERLKKTRHELNAKEKELAERERRILLREREQVTRPPPDDNIDVRTWTVDDVYDWACNLPSEPRDLTRYAAVLRDNHIDGRILLDLSQENLQSMGVVSLGHRLELHLCIRFLASENDKMLNFPPLNLPTPERRMSRAERSTLDLTVLLGHMVMKKGSGSADWKWKMYAEFDEELAGMDPAALVKSVEFGRHSSISTALPHKVAAPPYVMENWCIGIYEDMEIICLIYFNEEYVARPKHHKFVYNIPVSGETTAVQETLQILLHPTVNTVLSPEPRRLIPHSMSSPHLLHMWTSRQQDPLTSQQGTWASVAAARRTPPEQQLPPTYTSVTIRWMEPPKLSIPPQTPNPANEIRRSSSSSKTPGTPATPYPNSRSSSLQNSPMIGSRGARAPNFPRQSGYYTPARPNRMESIPVVFRVGSFSGSSPVESVSSFDTESRTSEWSGAQRSSSNNGTSGDNGKNGANGAETQTLIADAGDQMSAVAQAAARLSRLKIGKSHSPSPARSPNDGWTVVSKKSKKKPPLPKGRGASSATGRVRGRGGTRDPGRRIPKRS